MKEAKQEIQQSSASKCWVCGGEDHFEWKARNLDGALKSDDFKISDAHYGKTLALRKCRECDFVFASDNQLSQLEEFYESLLDEGYLNTQSSRRLQMRWILQQALAEHRNIKTLLDVGAGAGLLVSEAKNLGLEACGVELSQSLVDSALKESGLNLLQGTFPHPELAGRSFDVICLVDVIEHVPDPIGLLASCKQALSEDGLLLVVTPDIGSLAAKVLGQRWWHFRVAHIGYFSSRSVTVALERLGLRRRREFRARWFFPIDYLVERAAEYLPLGAINRFGRRFAFLRPYYSHVVSVNLRDSFVLILERASSSS